MAAAMAGVGIFSNFFGSVVSAQARNKAAKEEINELTRQQARDAEISREQKSDRAREADLALGTLLAASADTGQTEAGLARAGGEIAGISGLDIARIESNRQERSSALQSQKQSVSRNTKHANVMGLIGAFGSAANTLSTFRKAPGEKESEPTKGKTASSITKTSFKNQRGDF